MSGNFDLGGGERRKLVTIEQAMDIVHVSRRTIYNWINANKVKYVRTAGGQIRIFEYSLWVADIENPLDPPEHEPVVGVSARSRSWVVMCPDCDHGIRGGVPCETCAMKGYVLVALVGTI